MIGPSGDRKTGFVDSRSLRNKYFSGFAVSDFSPLPDLLECASRIGEVPFVPDFPGCFPARSLRNKYFSGGLLATGARDFRIC